MVSHDKEYWNNRYLNNNTGWDIGSVSAPLKTYIDGLEDKNISILIPGCGNAYEAEYLLQQGFKNITVIDISPVAVKAIEEKLQRFAGKELTLLCGDFFEMQGSFGLILEQTFFCAIPVSQRENYVNKVRELLSAEGRLAGVLFNRDFEGGPPFGGSIAEYQQLFGAEFETVKMEPCYNSITPRKGTELFIEFVKAADK